MLTRLVESHSIRRGLKCLCLMIFEEKLSTEWRPYTVAAIR